jgi:hypothetical protein
VLEEILREESLAGFRSSSRYYLRPSSSKTVGAGARTGIWKLMFECPGVMNFFSIEGLHSATSGLTEASYDRAVREDQENNHPHLGSRMQT